MANDEFEVKDAVAAEVDDQEAAQSRRERNGFRRFLPRIVSLILAVIVWVCVMEVNPPNAYKTFESVPIKVMNVAAAEVTAADGGELAVDVTVMAKKNQINSLDVQDITLIVDTSGIYENGTYQLEVICVLPSGFKVHELSSEVITVVVSFDSENS